MAVNEKTDQDQRDWVQKRLRQSSVAAVTDDPQVGMLSFHKAFDALSAGWKLLTDEQRGQAIAEAHRIDQQSRST